MPETDSTFSIRLPEPLKGELEALARATNRSRAYLVREAVAAYVRDRRAYVEDLLAAKQSAEMGPLHSSDQVFAWMESWGTEDEQPSPAPDLRSATGR